MKKIFTCALLIYSLVMLTACPAKSIETARAQSMSMARYANAGVDITRDLFREGVISLAQKDKIADGFLNLAKAGQLFDETLAAIEKSYGSNVPRTELEKLFESFNGIVVAKFLDLLKEMKLVGSGSRLGEVIEILRTTILAAAKIFGKAYEVRQQIEAI
ncbi:MAG TPA: hypothetical protein VIL74_20710 [Pyrinomonadaceae bacterium]